MTRTSILCWTVMLTLLLLARCGIGRRDHHKRGKGHGLVDPSLLLIQPIYHRYARRGMILDEDKEFVDYRWVIDRIDRRNFYDNYCPEVIYNTVLLDRNPPSIVHRKCDDTVWPPGSVARKCFSRNGNYTHMCKDQEAFRTVTYKGREMFQKVFVGCFCSAQYAWSN